MVEKEIRRVGEFEDDLRIDPMALDLEWLDQPQKYFKYAEQLAKAAREKDRCKQALLVARARVRRDLAKSGEKVTEGSIEEVLSQTEEWKDLSDSVYDENVLDASVKAMYQRKEALESLVRLQGQSYNAAPREPRDLAAEYVKRGKQKEETRRKLAATNRSGQ